MRRWRIPMPGRWVHRVSMLNRWHGLPRAMGTRILLRKHVRCGLSWLAQRIGRSDRLHSSRTNYSWGRSSSMAGPRRGRISRHLCLAICLMCSGSSKPSFLTEPQHRAPLFLRSLALALRLSGAGSSVAGFLYDLHARVSSCVCGR